MPGKAYALCKRCAAPLVMTVAFGHEFYCLDCGVHAKYFDVYPFTETPELDKRFQAYKAEWEEHTGDIIPGAGWKIGCVVCDSRGEYHSGHASAMEHKKHQDVLDWLESRARFSTTAKKASGT